MRDSIDGQQRLADPGAVQRDASPDLGEHPHRVRRRDLREVGGDVAVEDREVGRLAGGGDQLGEHRTDPVAEDAARGLAQAHEAGAQGVAATGLAPDVATVDQRGEQPVDGRARAAPRPPRAR